MGTLLRVGDVIPVRLASDGFLSLRRATRKKPFLLLRDVVVYPSVCLLELWWPSCNHEGS